MSTIKTLVSIGTSQSTGSWTPTAIRQSQIDQSNPTYPRIFRMDNQYVTLSVPGYIVGVSLSDLITAFIAIEPHLTWPPIITVQPVNVTVLPPASTSFTLTATSEISITYQWQKSTDAGVSWTNVTNAGVYSGATTNTLSISDTTGLNGVFYRCNVTNASGTTVSNVVSITLDPSINTQPSNVSVAAPAPASFTVSATGSTTLSYQWQRSDDGGSTWGNQTNTGVYTGATTSALNISDSTGLNGKKYRCVVTDMNGSVNSSSATLTVT